MPEKSHIPTIDDDEMRRAIGRSGYPLEQRVRRILERRGYYVQTNEAYPDPDTGISREYDFSAMTAVGRERDFVFTIIVGECQNNAQPIVFFEGGAGPAFLHHHDIQCSGLPGQALDW